MAGAAHESRAHATLGASSAYRWMACPASIRLSEGIESRSSVYADEGTAAHQLAERCLRRATPLADFIAAEAFVGGTETVRSREWDITEEMAGAVQVFVDTVTGCLQAPTDTLHVETRFDLSAIHPGMFGTNDACVISPARRTLYVLDYKHGKGKAVDAKGNPQLRYYGLGALLTLGKGLGIERLSLTIVQPRAPHADGPVRTDTITVMDLLDWSMELKAAAVRTEAPDAPVVAGDHCHFCLAAPGCAALRDAALQAAFTDFATLAPPPEPGRLDPGELARVLDAADMIDSWISAVRGHALRVVEGGLAVPGYKLVPKRAIRRWTEGVTAEGLMARFGLTSVQVHAAPKLLGPAAVEKLVPAKDRKPFRPPAKEGDESLVTSASSGTNLVKDSDPREPFRRAGVVEFETLF